MNLRTITNHWLCPALALLLSVSALADESADDTNDEALEETIEQVVEEENPDSTDRNESPTMNQVVEDYAARESLASTLIGGFVPYQPTYILPLTYMHDVNQSPVSPRTGAAGYDNQMNHDEAKYQISFRLPLLTGWLDNRTTLWFGYTQKSFWQFFNSKASRPFRETNYEPEIFLRYALNYDIGPGRLTAVTAGLNHQSNGQSEPRSRNWNRIKGSVLYTYDRWLFSVSPWYRLPENRNEDDNPDIHRYLGYAEYLAVYKWREDHTLSIRAMNNLQSDNKTSVELGYSFPIGDTLKGFVQYYNGYGESLIDYNVRIHRIGIGIMLNDWL
ncbi:phospholipase A [uncultured Marinobacter sp.]|uniref:phospholipase A n=1 Tax=uncultured Marinobacter sp. TaxID=187379 RepID=UPI0030DC9C6E